MQPKILSKSSCDIQLKHVFEITYSTMRLWFSKNERAARFDILDSGRLSESEALRANHQGPRDLAYRREPGQAPFRRAERLTPVEEKIQACFGGKEVDLKVRPTQARTVAGAGIESSIR
jgi:hypothetical protein